MRYLDRAFEHPGVFPHVRLMSRILTAHVRSKCSQKRRITQTHEEILLTIWSMLNGAGATSPSHWLATCLVAPSSAATQRERTQGG